MVDDFFQIKTRAAAGEEEILDRSKESLGEEELKRWEDEELLESIRHLFITGDDNPPGGDNGDTFQDEDEEDGEGNEGENDDEESPK
ncbi:hypothetical protein H0H87_006703, partial [Tephrocybe sp. NHM501043]